jgi:hypothetical protein
MQAPTLEYNQRNGLDSPSLPLRRPDQGLSAASPLDSIAFVLFVLANAVLFTRPSEIVPSLEGMPFYEVLIVGCLATAFPRVLPQFSVPVLLNRPITVCVLGLLVAIVLSDLSHGNIGKASVCGLEFVKLVVYYVLLVGVLNTPKRLQAFFTCLAGFIFVLAMLALLQYHQFINIPSLAAYREGTGRFDEWTGEPILLARLCSTGIFNDPNDLCLILIFGGVICLYRFTSKRWGPLRALWLLPVLLFGYALAVTHSRGGFLAMLASIMVFIIARFGWQRAIPIATAVLPVMFILFAGRATSISASEGTGQDRIKLWSEGFQLFKRAPVFGVGMYQYVEEVGFVAHNSFIHCYAELGLFGGTLFIAAFYYALQAVYQLGREPIASSDPDLDRLRPFLMAILAAYTIGYMALSRCYSLPTFLILGLVTVYLRLVSSHSRVEVPRLSLRLIQNCIVVSLGFVIVAYLFIRTFARFG